MLATWHPPGSFGFYAIVNLIGWFLIVSSVTHISLSSWLTDNDGPSFVPETSRYSLEELDVVFSMDTKSIVAVGWAQVECIVAVGWAQVEWLLTGGRLKDHKYPVLVPRIADQDSGNYPQELDDLGTLQETQISSGSGDGDIDSGQGLTTGFLGRR